MPGSGKTSVAEAGSELGLSVINMGDSVREESLRRRGSVEAEDVGEVMIELRRERGKNAVAELSIPRMQSVEGDVVLMDGIRSPAEIDSFRKLGPVKILAVEASRETRSERLLGRGRHDAPNAVSAFENRERREKSVGVEKVMAMADARVVNENVTHQEFVDNASNILNRWMNEGSG